jgi:glycine oxidase
MARIVVIGGGVIGCAIAERLSRDHHQVVVLERDRIAGQASGAAAGLLSPGGDSVGEGRTLGQRSLALFPELVARIERSGVAVEYRVHESLLPALSAADERGLSRSGARWLDAQEALAQEPELSPTIRGAAVLEEAQVTPARFVDALARTAVAQGAEVREGVPVGSLAAIGDRVRGVQTAEGQLEADCVVLAAGPWSPALTSPLGIALDVRPNRGQLVTLRPRGTGLRRAVEWRGNYLVPKPDGTIVAGSTEEEAGYDARPTAEGVTGLLQFATAAVPSLASATVERVWAALRPATPDGVPVVGAVGPVSGLIVATGHNRAGILLAPITAELVAEELAGG